MEQGAAPARHQFGAYEIMETVGQGGMGVVYRAYDTVLKRVVALKILRDDLRDQAHLVARFQREAEAFASLNHPNIVHIYSVGRVGRIPYIAMECIDGLPLSRLLKAERRLPWPRALQIAYEIAQALASAHDAQIIHRDIKPGNIIIANDGHAFVTDFGIAKVLNAETQLTVDGARLGTPQYMSPERCQGKETTAASDIYSLGILLFQMIAGQLPFHNDTPVGLIQQILADPPPRLSTVCPNVPDTMDRLVAYMIEKDPTARPASADALCEIMARVRDGKSLTELDALQADTLRNYEDAHTPSVPRPHLGGRMPRWVPRLRRALRKNPRYSTLAWIIAVALGAAVAATLSVVWTAKISPAAGAAPPLVRDVSRWQDRGPMASFIDEGPAVTAATIQLPDFAVRQAFWTGAPGVLAVQLDGAPGTAHNGESAAAYIDFTTRKASMIVPPHRNDGATFAVTGGALDQVFVRQASAPDTIFAWSTGGSGVFTTRTVRFPNSAISRIGLVAPHPHIEHFALAVEDNADRAWSIARMAGGGELEPWATAAGPIIAMHWSARGNALTYLTGMPNGERQLWFLPVGTEAPVPLASGALSVDSGAITPDGLGILISRQDGGRYLLSMLSPDPAAAPAALGEGWAGGWSARGEAVFTALDNQGRVQMWKCLPASPGTRTPLTFLSGGTETWCSVSMDGIYAVTAAEGQDRPALVLVHLAP
jgi:serine/threonine protein kinase